MDINKIKELTEMMSAHGLTKLEIEEEGIRILLEAESSRPMEACPPRQQTYPLMTLEETAQKTPAAEDTDRDGVRITSPLVGTVYLAPAKDKPDFVKIGASVKKGDTVCMIESMKMLNDIYADCDGTVEKICVANGDLIEFGQTIVIIKPKA